MIDREKVMKGLRCIKGDLILCVDCAYSDGNGHGTYSCKAFCANDAITMLKEQDEEHRRLLSWLGKFCRHIDNGDAWLTDEENIAFFKEKMKQQFGWDTD